MSSSCCRQKLRCPGREKGAAVSGADVWKHTPMLVTTIFIILNVWSSAAHGDDHTATQYMVHARAATARPL